MTPNEYLDTVNKLTVALMQAGQGDASALQRADEYLRDINAHCKAQSSDRAEGRP